jgi:hypothetical protein
MQVLSNIFTSQWVESEDADGRDINGKILYLILKLNSDKTEHLTIQFYVRIVVVNEV